MREPCQGPYLSVGNCALTLGIYILMLTEKNADLLWRAEKWGY